MGCLLSDATLHLIPLVGHFGVLFMLTIRVDLKVVFLFFRVIHCRQAFSKIVLQPVNSTGLGIARAR